MSKGDNVKEYLYFIREANRPLYTHEMYDVMMELKRLEKKLTVRQISDIKFLMDYDLCLKYDLEPKDINPKYVGYVLDEEDKRTEEKVRNIIVVSEHRVLSDKLKTDYETKRNDIVKQVMSKSRMLKELDEEKFEEMML